MFIYLSRWSVESVHTKNIVSILHLLVALARHFRWVDRWMDPQTDEIID